MAQTNFFNTPESLTIAPTSGEKGIIGANLLTLLTGIPAGGLIVDCCSGAQGKDFYPPELSSRVVCVDNAPLQLQQASSEPGGVADILFGDVTQHIPVPDGSAAAVVVVRGARYFDQAQFEPFAREAERALAPDGKLVMLDYPTIRDYADVVGIAPQVIEAERSVFNPEAWGDVLVGQGFSNVRTEFGFIPELRMHLVVGEK